MKKNYIEPKLVVEDFTISEMVAANCVMTESEVKVVTQMSHMGCPASMPMPEGDVYAKFSDTYDGGSDWDGDSVGDFVFTKAYYEASGRSPYICSFDPFAVDDKLFGEQSGLTCTGDTTDLHNS